MQDMVMLIAVYRIIAPQKNGQKIVMRGCSPALKSKLLKEPLKPAAGPSNMSGKRQSFATGALPAAKAARASQGPDILVACVRPWGRASWVFEGRGTYAHALMFVH